MKSLFILVIIPVLMLAVPNVYTSEDIAHIYQGNRPAINPEFDPDESCLFDVFQLKCVPGSQQECPESFASAEPENCYPKHSEGCPEGYHGTDDDETGQCYPNSEGCKGYTIKDGIRFDYVLLEDRPDKGDRCAKITYLCHESDTPDHPACKEFLEGQEK